MVILLLHKPFVYIVVQTIYALQWIIYPNSKTDVGCLEFVFSQLLCLSGALSNITFLLSIVLEQKSVIRMEKDKAKMAEAFLEMDDDADGL